jgi:stearoyl-CoA desaturase (delta-9 desaturase)
MWIILGFFLLHWCGSLFMQSFYLHRFASHGMIHLTPFWSKFFHFMTFIFQGSSYLNPRAYAYMHKQHHKHSDETQDPHSPHHVKNAWEMMWKTAEYYQNLVYSKNPEHHQERVKDGPWTDFANSWTIRLSWGVFYFVFYMIFAPSEWYFLLLPIHFLMGPIHGAIVNWCGHKYGYRNHSLGDRSVNTLPIDFLALGELYQNNHHHSAKKLNFAQKWFEIDFTYWGIVILMSLGMVKLPKNEAQPAVISI